MMVSPVRGEFTEATATIWVAHDPLQSSMTATIRTGSIDTQNADRDVHLSSPDFLDVERHPTMEYRSTGVKWQGGNDAIFMWARLRNNKLGRRGTAAELPDAATQAAGKFVVTGDLTIKDVTQQVDLQLDFGGARRDPVRAGHHRFQRGRGDQPGRLRPWSGMWPWKAAGGSSVRRSVSKSAAKRFCSRRTDSASFIDCRRSIPRRFSTIPPGR